MWNLLLFIVILNFPLTNFIILRKLTLKSLISLPKIIVTLIGIKLKREVNESFYCNFYLDTIAGSRWEPDTHPRTGSQGNRYQFVKSADRFEFEGDCTSA